MKYSLPIFIFSLLSLVSFSQETFPLNGAPDKRHIYYAFTHAKIYTDYQTVVENATLLIKDGLVVDAGINVLVPKGAVVYDLKGKFIYPSFIDIYSTYGMPELKKPIRNRGPQPESNTKGAYGWNQAIKPETDAVELFVADSKSAEELLKLGFGTVMSFNRDGIARGSSVLTTLSDKNENESILKDKASALYSFSKGSSTQDYPSSLMGTIALIRQTYYDALWYKQNKSEFNISLDAWNKQQNLPQIFEVNDKLSALRADKIGDEFKVQFIIKGSGDEYQRMGDIKSTGAKFILPLNFPAPFDLEDPYDAEMVSFTELKHWEMAPLNPSAFEKNAIPFALTTDGLKDKKDFWKNLKKAIEYGLSEKAALKALTATPAEMLGVQDKVGALKKGMVANFVITNGNLFEDKTGIYENWVQGSRYIYKDANVADMRGNYSLQVGGNKYNMIISGEADKPTVEISSLDSSKADATFSLSDKVVSLLFSFKKDAGPFRLNGTLANTGTNYTLKGKGQSPTGAWVNWNTIFLSANEVKKDSSKKANEKTYPSLNEVVYPFISFGMKKNDSVLVEKDWNRWDAILIKNVTVWTNEAEGVLKNKDVMIVAGKIQRMGDNLDAYKTSKTKVIDGIGKHLSPGIIDEHSHIAVSSGLNEGGQASTAEVRIGDVVDCEDISIYRNLSGGVVASQLLHGSANPIGGQSALVKLRWGASPEEMKVKAADGFIKFALGENVKQSNWGEAFTVRFPQTRMGVEQVYYDYFTRAKEYEAQQKATAVTDKPMRRNLELDAISEILNKKRFITCHSYVQSEINMLMHVADSMGFKVNTFTHILEGYKVADKMKAHGVGGSTFADWWAYKMEVKEAIPHNAAILHKMGIVTAINSDDPEMSRRLNQEAAKTIKYGNLSEEEALKLVTLNPAKLLHVDNSMGSIKVGKSADVVLWTDNPLSVYAKADKTIVDGKIYYDIETDAKLREELNKERTRIINLMIKAKKGGEPTFKPEKKEKKNYNCHSEE